MPASKAEAKFWYWIIAWSLGFFVGATWGVYLYPHHPFYAAVVGVLSLLFIRSAEILLFRAAPHDAERGE